MRRAQPGYVHCRRHSDVVAGVMLGVCASGVLEDALKKLEKKLPEERPKYTNGKPQSGATRKSGAFNRSMQHHLTVVLKGGVYDRTETNETFSHGEERDLGALMAGHIPPFASCCCHVGASLPLRVVARG